MASDEQTAAQNLDGLRRQIDDKISRGHLSSHLLCCIYEGLLSGSLSVNISITSPPPTPPLQLLRAPISVLDLSVRAFNCLDSAGADTVGRVIQFSRDSLLEITNLGPTTADEIERAVNDCGLNLGTKLLPEIIKKVGIPKWLTDWP